MIPCIIAIHGRQRDLVHSERALMRGVINTEIAKLWHATVFFAKPTFYMRSPKHSFDDKRDDKVGWRVDVDTLNLANIRADKGLNTGCVKLQQGYTEVHACTPVARTYRLQMGNTEQSPHTAKPHRCKRSKGKLIYQEMCAFSLYPSCLTSSAGT